MNNSKNFKLTSVSKQPKKTLRKTRIKNKKLLKSVGSVGSGIDLDGIKNFNKDNDFKRKISKNKTYNEYVSEDAEKYREKLEQKTISDEYLVELKEIEDILQKYNIDPNDLKRINDIFDNLKRIFKELKDKALTSNSDTKNLTYDQLMQKWLEHSRNFYENNNENYGAIDTVGEAMWTQIIARPEHKKEQLKKMTEWKNKNNDANIAALKIMRGFIPKDIQTISKNRYIKELKQKVDNESAINLANYMFNINNDSNSSENNSVANITTDTILRKDTLKILRKTSAEIKTMPLADLYKLNTSNFDIIELRAIYSILPDKFEADVNGNKLVWLIENKQSFEKRIDEKMSKSGKQYRNPVYTVFNKEGLVIDTNKNPLFDPTHNDTFKKDLPNSTHKPATKTKDFEKTTGNLNNKSKYLDAIKQQSTTQTDEFKKKDTSYDKSSKIDEDEELLKRKDRIRNLLMQVRDPSAFDWDTTDDEDED